MNDKTTTPTGKEVREWVQITIIVFTVIWTSYEFFFKEFIKPAHEPTALELAAKLEYAGEKDGFIIIRGSISALNPTSRRIYVPAFWYTVRGYRVALSDQRITDETIRPEDMPQQIASRHYSPLVSSEIVVEEKILSGQHTWWDPKDKTSDEISFVVPKDKFDFMDLYVSYILTRNNDELLEPMWGRTDSGDLAAILQFNEEKTPEQQLEWELENSAGQNWAEATLPLWEHKN